MIDDGVERSPELLSYLLLPMASISSINTIDGDRSSATLNNSLTVIAGENENEIDQNKKYADRYIEIDFIVVS